MAHGTRAILAVVWLGIIAGGAFGDPPASIDVSWFRDGAHHWRRIRDDKRVIQAEPDQPSYKPEQIREIAANILLFQRANGGWPKDYDMTVVLTDKQRSQLAVTRTRDDTSFDNHNIFPQVEYLAQVFVATGDVSFRDASLRGFDFMLAAQYPNGGIPQSHPKAGGYSQHITFNDGAMIGVLRVLNDAAEERPHFAWLDAPRREKARGAVRRGVDCILKCQIRVDGQLTGWCQQHDRETYAPASARTFELASLCPQDTTEIVRFLMSQKPATPEIIQAVEAAVRWLNSVKLTGVRVVRVAAPKEEFLRHTADFDVVVVADPKAPLIWARHYEIGTNRPVFAGRDAVKRYQLAEIERERRTGTPWYGAWPQALLTKDYPAWRERIKDAP
jgi:PelA/Pel-15E family pectate lyase